MDLMCRTLSHIIRAMNNAQLCVVDEELCNIQVATERGHMKPSRFVLVLHCHFCVVLNEEPCKSHMTTQRRCQFMDRNRHYWLTTVPICALRSSAGAGAMRGHRRRPTEQEAQSSGPSGVLGGLTRYGSGSEDDDDAMHEGGRGVTTSLLAV